MESNGKYLEDVTNRYIYQVVRRLGASQRDEIKKELQGLIEDMLSERTENPTKEDIDAVLTELGRPSELANKYRDSKQYLIGPEYFSLYIFILKIVLGAVALGMAVALTVGFITAPPQDISAAIGTFFDSIFMALLQAFAWLTFGFAMAERYNKRKITFQAEKWKPSDLPPVPLENATIRRSGPIVGMVFILLFMMIFNVAPQIFSVYVGSGAALTVVPVFNLARWPEFIALFNVLFALGLAKEFVRLLFGRYNFRLAAAITVINILAVVLSVILFTNPGVWNPAFAQTLQNAHAFGMASDFNLAYYFDLFKNVFVGLIVFGYIVDTITVLVRGIRYSVSYKEI